jgi:ribosome-associated protein
LVCIRRRAIALESEAKALAIASASFEKKATDVQILHVAKLTSVTDYLVLCSGESERQVRAIADHIDVTLTGLGAVSPRVEGATASQWILLDFGDVVVHVFRTDIRDLYGLERLWSDAARVPLPDQALTPSAVVAVSARKARARARRHG